MVEVQTIDPRSLMRSTLYDCSFAQPEKVIADLGIPVVSEEGAEFEREASHRRKHALDPIGPILVAQCAWAALACVYERYDYEPDKDSAETMHVGASFNGIITATVVGILSTLVDRGLVRIMVTEVAS